MKDILLVGAGGHARVVADVIRITGQYRVYGFLDGVNPERHGQTYEGARILGGDELLAGLRESVEYAVVAIGENDARVRLGSELLRYGYQLPTLVHPSAVVAAGIKLGAGTVVCAGVVINPAAEIGAHVIINTAASVDHDCRIGDGVHVGPGAHLGGHVIVGAHTLIGVGVAVKPHTRIGERAVIGVGSAVVGDVDAGSTVAGVPARVIS